MKVIYARNYFNKKTIEKLTLEAIPTQGIGDFKYRITVTFKKWYNFSEDIELDSKDEAEKMLKYLTSVMNKDNTFKDIIGLGDNQEIVK